MFRAGAMLENDKLVRFGLRQRHSTGIVHAIRNSARPASRKAWCCVFAYIGSIF